MKTILMGATPPPVGGIAGWTVRMMQVHQKNNWELVLVDEKINTGREMFGTDTRRRNIGKELKRWFSIWRQLQKRLRDVDVKVVHVCPTAEIPSMIAELVSGIITKRYKRKFIVHFRCTVPNMISGKLNLTILKLLCNKSDLIIALNGQTKKYLAEHTKTPVKLIPNFVNAKETINDRHTKESIGRVVYVGGVIPEKGCLDIVEVAKVFPEIEFRMVGRVDESVAEKANSVNNVVLVGVKNRSEVKEELENADVFMFLSYYPGEGFSNALAEAMAAGLPCVVTDWAANADMIEDGRGGFLVNIKSPEEAVEALRKLKSSTTRNSFSEFNANKAKQKYEEQIVVDRYVDCYERVMLGPQIKTKNS